MQKKARASTKRKTRQKKMETLKKIFTKTSHYCGKPKEIFKERCIEKRNCSTGNYFPAIGWVIMRESKDFIGRKVTHKSSLKTKSLRVKIYHV